jgi:hypothetical protein
MRLQGLTCTDGPWRPGWLGLTHNLLWNGLVAIVSGFVLCSAAKGDDSGSAEYQWVQYVPGGLEARAITDSPKCPPASLNGKLVAMRVRALPFENFRNLVCSLPLPPGTNSVAIRSKPLPLPKPRPQKILLIGDTGCSIRWPNIQGCSDEAQWPFRLGAEIGSEMKPDLVIHLGDLHYRFMPCAPSASDCTNTGDRWDIWKADFFDPARDLLSSVPFVFVRGNHEMCEAGGIGWSRALDPYPLESLFGCLRPGKPFTVNLGDVTLVVMDVSTADDDQPQPKQVERFHQQFLSLKQLVPNGPAWLAFHRPIWSAAASMLGLTFGDNKTLALAARNSIPANVQMFLSGHQHTFQVLSYVDDLPVQIVSGHGGAELHKFAPTNPAGMVINGEQIRDGRGTPGTFGFAMLERPADSGDWIVNDYNVHGQLLVRCRIHWRNLACN